MTLKKIKRDNSIDSIDFRKTNLIKRETDTKEDKIRSKRTTVEKNRTTVEKKRTTVEKRGQLQKKKKTTVEKKRTTVEQIRKLQNKRGQNKLFPIKEKRVNEQYYTPAMVLFSRLAPLKFAPEIRRYLMFRNSFF